MKELKIVPPDGYVVDEENSTFECIKFKPKELTYDEIQKEICHVGRDTIGWPEDKCLEKTTGLVIRPSNCPTIQQCKRLLAINQLMNVAYYFNEVVDKDKDPEIISYFGLNHNNELEVCHYFKDKSQAKTQIATFKTLDSIKKTIEILGKETVKLAISL